MHNGKRRTTENEKETIQEFNNTGTYVCIGDGNIDWYYNGCLAAAQNFNVDITASADEIQSAGENIIFGPGDSITYKSSEIGSTNTIVIYLRNGSASINQHNYGSI